MAKFADHMQKISGDVVTGYKKIEKGVVGAYKKVEAAFVNTFMAKEGESVQDAKARVAADTEVRSAAQKAMVQKNLEASRNAGKRK
jgi:hypothetical protein